MSRPHVLLAVSFVLVKILCLRIFIVKFSLTVLKILVTLTDPDLT